MSWTEGKRRETVTNGEESTWPGMKERVGFALGMQRGPRTGRENPSCAPTQYSSEWAGSSLEEGACVCVCVGGLRGEGERKKMTVTRLVPGAG